MVTVEDTTVVPLSKANGDAVNMTFLLQQCVIHIPAVNDHIHSWKMNGVQSVQ